MVDKEEGSNPTQVKYPDCHVRLSGTDGNVFALLGLVAAELRRAGHPEAASQLSKELWECGSYDEALQLFASYVEVS